MERHPRRGTSNACVDPRRSGAVKDAPAKALVFRRLMQSSGTTLQISARRGARPSMRAGQRVLDVAAGKGNVTLAAARRW